MTTARSVPFPAAEQYATATRGRGVDAAKHLLEGRGEELVALGVREDEKGPARAQDVKCLLNHVDLQLPLAACRGGVQKGLEIAGQVPQVSGRNDLRRGLPGRQLLS